MTTDEINAIGVMIAGLRDPDERAVIVSVGAHGPSHDMPAGHVSAAVRVGEYEATAGAKYLADAITLARGILRREAEARAAKAAKKKELAA